MGEQAAYAERMKGNLRDVIEIKVDDDRGGIATPQKDLDRIEQRLKAARKHHEEQQKRNKHQEPQ